MTTAMIPSDSNPIDLTVSDIERRIMKVTHKEAAECELHGVFARYFNPNRPEGSNCPSCAADAQKIKDDEEREEASK